MINKLLYAYLNNKLNKVYNENFLRKGKTPNGLFWNSHFNQIKRIQELLDILLLYSQSNITKIADVGCGFGTMYKLIKNNIKYKNFLYQGVDINKQFINECNLSFKNEVLFYYGASPSETVDYSIMSGTYNYSTSKSIDIWEDYIIKNLLECLKYSKKGILLNLQFSIPTKIQNNIFYADPLRFKKKFLKISNNNCKYFKSSYFENDVIFFIKKTF